MQQLQHMSHIHGGSGIILEGWKDRVSCTATNRKMATRQEYGKQNFKLPISRPSIF